MKWLLTLTVFLYIGTSVAGECEFGDCVNIGSYNIKLLGNGGPADTPAETRQIVERIAVTAELDIVALQEINVGSEVWSELMLPGMMDNGFVLTGFGQFGGADQNRQQHVVLLHRDATIEVLDAVFDMEMESNYRNGKCKYDSVRPPIVARFSFRATELTLRASSSQQITNRSKWMLSVRVHDRARD